MRTERLTALILIITALIVLTGCGPREENIKALQAVTPTLAPSQTPEPSPTATATQDEFVLAESALPIPYPSEDETPEVVEATPEVLPPTEEDFIDAVRVATVTPPVDVNDGSYILAVPANEEDAQRATQNAEMRYPQPLPTSNLPVRVAIGTIGSPVNNVVTLRFEERTSPQERQQIIAEMGGTVEQEIEQLGTVVVSVPNGNTTVPEAANVVVNTEPDYYVRALADFTIPPGDEYYPQQWALSAIDAPRRWAALDGEEAPVVVAVIDSGVCADHPDLQGRLVPGWDFVEDDSTPQDELGHGCGTAGIIAAQIDNGTGMAGIAPNARVMPLRVLDGSGLGRYSDVASAIVYAVDNGAQVVNISLGGIYDSTILLDAVGYAVQNGVTVVAAAGNESSEQLLYPAAYASVYAVGSVDSDLERSSFSNYGDNVDLWAPGSLVLSTTLTNSYASMSGTSFAAPHAAAIAALQIGMGQSVFTEPLISEDTQPASTATPAPAPIEQVNAPQLFASADAAMGQGTLPSTGVMRSRTITLKGGVLPTLAEAFSQSVQYSQITLNFFDDVAYTVTLDAVTARPGNTPGYVWQGTIDGVAGSEVILVVDRDGYVTGHANIGGQVFEIRQTGGAVHLISEIAANRYFSGGTPDYTTMPVDPNPVLPDVNAADAADTIDVMVAYTAAARQAAGGTGSIEGAIDANYVSTNNSFINSGVNFRFNLVGKFEVNYSESGSLSTDRTNASNGQVAGLEDLRNNNGADIVTLIVESGEADLCGFAYVMPAPSVTYEQFAYNIVKRSCMAGGQVYAHENGHTMGGSHDLANNGGFGSYDYSNGYQATDGNFATIMAFPFNGACGVSCQWIMRWSSDTGTFNNRPVGTAELNDMVSTLNQNAYVVANFRASQQVETITVQREVNPPGAGEITVTYDGQETQQTTFPMGAQLTVQATANEGYEFNNWNFPGETNGSNFFIEFPTVTTTDSSGVMTITANFVASGVPNDNTDAATLIESFPYTDSMNTDDATIIWSENPSDGNDYEQYFSCHAQVGHTVWYRFVGDGSIYAINTIGSNYDTTLAVYRGNPSSINNINEVACDFSDSTGGDTRLVIPTVDNANYYIGVAGTRSDSGDLVLNVNRSELVANGDFNQGREGWSIFGGTDWFFQDGVLNITRTNTSSNAGFFQDLGDIALVSGEKLETSLQLGNTSNSPKQVRLRLGGRDSLGLAETFICSFSVPANSPLAPYTLQTILPPDGFDNEFSDFEVRVFVDDFSQPNLLVDNVSVEIDNTLTVTETVCDEPPSIDSTIPRDGALAVAVDADITLNVSELVRGNVPSIALVCQPGNVVVDFGGGRSGTTYFIRPRSDLPTDSACTLMIPTANVTDRTGNNLLDTDGTDDGMYMLTFNTEGSPPRIASTVPEQGAVDVPVSTNVSLTMSKAIQRPERDGVRFVCQPGNVPIRGRLSVSGLTYTLDPRDDLPADSTCTLSIPTSNIQDGEGQTLVDTDSTDDGRYELTFETGSSVPLVAAASVLEAQEIVIDPVASTEDVSETATEEAVVVVTATPLPTPEPAQGLPITAEPATAEGEVLGEWSRAGAGWQISGADTAALTWNQQIDLSGATQPTLSYISALDASQAVAAVQVQATGREWTTVSVATSDVQQSIDLSAFAGETILIRFLWLGGAEGATWTVSNITVADVAPATATPTATPVEPTDPETVETEEPAAVVTEEATPLGEIIIGELEAEESTGE